MRLSDYIQGLRKGKEAHRLEKESMKDPFLADAIDGYNQVEGNHEQRIEQLRIQISARSTKKRNTYAIIWSVAACLVIGFGISSYFLFLKETPEPVIPIIPQKEIALVPTKTKTDSTPISPVSTKQADKKDIIAKSRTTISKPPSAPITTMPMEEETSGQMVAATDEEVIMTTGASDPESVKKMRIAKMAVIPTNDIIKGKVTDQKGEPLIGASVMYKGTNIGTVTDVNGEFSLLKKAENKQLTAQYIGYDPVEVPVVGHGVNKKANKDNTPQPVDGKRKYLKYLKKNLVRPTDETCAQVKGKVVLTFLVNRDGRPFHIKVKKSLCESSDKEAIRLVQEGPDWTYGNKQAEVTVKFD